MLSLSLRKIIVFQQKIKEGEEEAPIC